VGNTLKSSKINSAVRDCETCKGKFKVYKKRQKSCCSIECFNQYILRSEIKEKRLKSNIEYNLKNYGVKYACTTDNFVKKAKETKKKKYGNETWVNPEKAKLTKMKKYGDPNYNNINKYKKTMLSKYGVDNAFHLPKSISNGKRISKFQRKVYEDIKLKNPSALLEHYLPDADKSVDIYIPDENRIIECFGDYWHCNPNRYKKDYYNTQVHLTAVIFGSVLI